MFDNMQIALYSCMFNRFTGIGSLRIPHIPEQFKSYQGSVVHTAAWDWSVDFKDKRVAIIGSGSRYK
jgi:cation diffusion facilitator CzcD-associated flavoprotein CzcO